MKFSNSQIGIGRLLPSVNLGCEIYNVGELSDNRADWPRASAALNRKELGSGFSDELQLPYPKLEVRKPTGKSLLLAVHKGFEKCAEEALKQIPILGPLLLALSTIAGELGAAEDQDQFEEKLLQAMETNQQFLQDLSEVGDSLLIELKQNSDKLDALISALTNAGVLTERSQLEELALETALISHRQRVALEYLYADYRGISGIVRTEHAASLQLDSVYVEPRFGRDRDFSDNRVEESDILEKLLRAEDLRLPERTDLEEKYAELTGQRWRSHGKQEQKDLTLGNLFQQAKHTVVLGEPGAGKSVMLRYLARTSALGAGEMQKRLGWSKSLTPILLSLAAFADWQNDQKRKQISLDLFVDDKLKERGGVALQKAMEAEFQQGNVLLLLDGVDEIPDYGQRVRVVRRVEEFIAQNQQNTIIITSRPYGYIRFQDAITHVQLLKFNLEQVKTFVLRWHDAFELWRHPQAPKLELARSEAEGMIAEIQRHQKVIDLATNPLMLVIICLIRHEQARLPEQRVKLYSRALNTLLDTWNQWRSELPQASGVQLSIENLTNVLSKVARWTRSEKPIIHREELHRKIVSILRDEELDNQTPEATAKSYLEAIVGKAGLLEERSNNIFAFWHPTFEEYLSAIALTTPTSKTRQNLLPLRHDPRWREIILLAVGHISLIRQDRDTATELAKDLLEADEPQEIFLHKNLRLVTACIADDIGLKRSFILEVISRLAKVIQLQPYSLFKQSFIQISRSFPTSFCIDEQRITDLEPLLTNEDLQIRMESTRLLSTTAKESTYAKQLCEKQLGDSDADVCCHAALGLARAGDYKRDVWLALAKFRSQGSEIEVAVSDFLKKALPPEALSSLIGLLSDDAFDIRLEAARLLQQMGNTDPRIARTLIDLLSDNNSSVRLDAARLLQQMGITSTHVVETLFDLLSGDNSFIRMEAVGILYKMESGPRVVETLIDLLSGDNFDIRLSVAIMLKSMKNTENTFPYVVKTLFELLSVSFPARIRVLAALNLRQIGLGFEEVLIDLLSDTSSDIRLQAALILQQDDSYSIHLKAAGMLPIESTGSRVVETLIGLLSDDASNIRLQAASLLQVMEITDPCVVGTLIDLLSDASSDIRLQAASLLQQNDNYSIYLKAAGMLPIESTSSRVVETLIGLLSDASSDIRLRATSLLQQMLSTDPHVVEILVGIIAPSSQELLLVCQKVQACEPLFPSDYTTLSSFLNVTANDVSVLKAAKELMFNLLSQKLESYYTCYR
jgi:HEAT repeat protein